MKANNKKRVLTIIMVMAMFLLFFGNTTMRSHATETNNAPIPFSFDLSVGASEDGQDVVSSIQILVILTLISLAPSILIMMTSFIFDLVYHESCDQSD